MTYPVRIAIVGGGYGYKVALPIYWMRSSAGELPESAADAALAP